MHARLSQPSLEVAGGAEAVALHANDNERENKNAATVTTPFQNRALKVGFATRFSSLSICSASAGRVTAPFCIARLWILESSGRNDSCN